MAKAVQKIKLSPSRDIPFNKLVLAQSNVRRTKAGISIEDLAEDIARRVPAAKSQRPADLRRRRPGHRHIRGCRPAAGGIVHSSFW